MAEDLIHKLLKSVLIDEQLENAKIIIKEPINGGYCCKMSQVTIENGRKLELIIKLPPDEPQAYVKLCYQTEIYFYETIVPHFNRLQMKYIGKPFTFAPAFYKASNEPGAEAIVLSNLVTKGYTMIDKRVCFKDEYMELVLKELGKFHALSFALQKADPQVWDSLDNGVDQSLVYEGPVAKLVQKFLLAACTLFDSNSLICQSLKNVNDNFDDIIKKMFRPSETSANVISHLDPWCNNLLFKHADGHVVDVVLVDYQQATKASPVLDIACFIYINGDAGHFARWKTLLEVYYASLVEHAARLNCPIEEVYSFGAFLNDWREYAVYGMIKSVFGIPLNTRSDEEIKALNVAQEDHFAVKKWSPYTQERVRSLLEHMNKENLLPLK